jgi:hypothetical protein
MGSHHKGLVSAAVERRDIQKKPPLPALADMMSRLGQQPYLAIQPLVVNTSRM